MHSCSSLGRVTLAIALIKAICTTAHAQSVIELRVNPVAINADGSVICGSAKSGPALPAVWNRLTDELYLLEPMPGTSGHESAPKAISGDGSVVVGFGGVVPRVAVRWTQGVIEVVESPPAGGDSYAHAVNFDGTRIAGLSVHSDGSKHGWLWHASTGAVALPLPLIDGVQCVIPTCINADGSIVAGYAVVPAHNGSHMWRNLPCVFFGGFCHTLDFGTEYEATVASISANGQTVIGGINELGGGSPRQVFRWQVADNVVIILETSLVYAMPGSITDDGRSVLGMSFFAQPWMWGVASGKQPLLDWLDARGLNVLQHGFTGNCGAVEPMMSADRTTILVVAERSSMDWVGFEIPRCKADFDQSGFVDIEDYGVFVSSFEAGTSDADFDASGFVDVEDFGAFVRAFEIGC